MTGVWLGKGDIADERDLAENVLGRVAFMLTAIDDGDGEMVLMPEEHHHGHWEDAIDLTGYGREFSTRVFAAF